MASTRKWFGWVLNFGGPEYTWSYNSASSYITHADQHQDHGAELFFMRVEWALDGFDLSGFRAEFQPTAAELQMEWQLKFMSEVPRVAIFVSQQLHCSIPVVISNPSRMINVHHSFLPAFMG